MNFYNEEWFNLILINIDKSCVKNFDDAISREFFRGVYELEITKNFMGNYSYITHEICPPALDMKSVIHRLQDTRFCKKCLCFKKHDYNCVNSPWK